ncbi:unnamed protein product [Cylicostephanus goldi]|uniref:EGF-like domain-containing protein n=1 Tax=Cylicostephanus goldi TaxID=71465 RepID=A0A3P6TBG7_CYLGO|nr:unnamed protein product [Cylicostephanus goldi]
MPSTPGVSPKTLETAKTSTEAILPRVPPGEGKMAMPPRIRHTTTPTDTSSREASTQSSFPTLTNLPRSFSSMRTRPPTRTFPFTRGPRITFRPRIRTFPHRVLPTISTFAPPPSPSPTPITLQRIVTSTPTAPTTAPSTAPLSTFAPRSTSNHPPLNPTHSVKFPEMGLKTTTEDDLSVVVESFGSTTGIPSDASSLGKHGRCTPSDRSMCHELAICEIATGACRCKDGFSGDGYSNCT